MIDNKLVGAESLLLNYLEFVLCSSIQLMKSQKQILKESKMNQFSDSFPYQSLLFCSMYRQRRKVFKQS